MKHDLNKIENHISLLLDKYNLRSRYNFYIFISVTTTIARESFYWALLYFSEVVKKRPELLKLLASILIILIAINVPVERMYTYVKAKFMEEIKLANTNYFNDRLVHLSKKNILSFDLVEYFNTIRYLSYNLEEYIHNLKHKYEIPIRFITLIIIAVSKSFLILIGMFFIYYIIIKKLNEEKILKEQPLLKKFFDYENDIRNYLINSKNFLINDELNKEYLSSQFKNFEAINRTTMEVNNILDMKINFVLVIFIFIVIGLKIKELNPYDFFYYFIAIYDIEYISDKVQEYYKNKVHYNKMEERLNFLNSFTPEYNKKINSKDFVPIDSILINKIKNENPTINNTDKLEFKVGEPVLIDGESGSGKTSLFYVLKGVVKADELDCNIDIEQINCQSFLTLPTHKNLYNDKLFDLISNYDPKPNIDLIKYAIHASKLDEKIDYENNEIKNDIIDVDKLSGGERVRLIIARLIYIVKTKNYKILLFDEIDENLNKKLANDICINLKNIFSDKIILYITHNDTVKQTFNKKYIVKDGVITSNNF